MLKPFLAAWLRKRGKLAFVKELGPSASILDVGCGDNSSVKFKQIRPDCPYTGIDVGDYQQTMPSRADLYIVVPPDEFASRIAQFQDEFDAVVSSHNLEHCNDRAATLNAMLGALKSGGDLYLAFPCAESVRFPYRWGTLNYYGDKSHREAPPDVDAVLTLLSHSGFQIIFAERRYRPFVLWAIGALLEPFSHTLKRVLPGTWDFYGFESVIWARKSATAKREGPTTYPSI